MKNLAFFCFFLVLIILLQTGESFIAARLKLSSSLANIFLWDANGAESEIQKLRLENEALRAELLVKSLKVNGASEVFSIYPYSNVKEIAINYGVKDGAKEGQAVIYEKNLLVGKISKVFSDYSIVSTLYDPSFKMEIRIGAKQSDGLFVGGTNPQITLVSKGSDIEPDDEVLSAAAGFPYGLLLGRIKEIKNDAGDPIKKAVLTPAVELKDLRNVEVR